MKIALTSQNKREITAHAGKCRVFWIYHIHERQIVEKTLLEVPRAQTFHESSATDPHPLDDIKVFITKDMGMGLIHRLEQKGIEAIITAETEPDKAVRAYLEGRLERLAPDPNHQGHRHTHQD